jgi:hypothetical protein
MNWQIRSRNHRGTTRTPKIDGAALYSTVDEARAETAQRIFRMFQLSSAREHGQIGIAPATLISPPN